MGSRWRFWRVLHSHWIFRAALMIWATLGAVEILLPFFPTKWSEKFYGLSYLPKWHWYVWVIGFLLIALIAVFEAGHSQFRKIADLNSSDPMLYFELVDNRTANLRCTPLLVKNKGGSLARKISIHPIKMTKATAEFRQIDHLDAGASPAEAIPEISDCSPVFKYDLLNLLQHEANDTDKQEVAIEVSVTYRDQTETKCFTMPFEIVFNSLQFALQDGGVPINRVAPIYEIRHGRVSVCPC